MEFGPGTGEMARIMLKTMGKLEVLKKRLFSFVEASPKLREEQQSIVNKVCLELDISLEYLVENGEEIYRCDENELVFVWYSSADDFFNKLNIVDEKVCGSYKILNE